jgi:hypothetical protein
VRTLASAPPKRPIGVRTASQMKTSRMSLSFERRPFRSSRGRGKFRGYRT